MFYADNCCSLYVKSASTPLCIVGDTHDDRNMFTNLRYHHNPPCLSSHFVDLCRKSPRLQGDGKASASSREKQSEAGN